MIVTVVDRKAMADAWGSPGLYTIITRTVEISDICPRCGGPRTKPHFESMVEDGHRVQISRWHNACRHIDKYPDVIAEAQRLRAVSASELPQLERK